MYIRMIGIESETKWWSCIKLVSSFMVEEDTSKDKDDPSRLVFNISFVEPLNRKIYISSQLSYDDLLNCLLYGKDLCWIMINNSVVWFHQGLSNDDIGCNLYLKAMELYKQGVDQNGTEA